MSKPSRAQLWFAAALVVLVALLATLVLRPTKTGSAAPVTTTTVPCASKSLASDLQIDQCLTSHIALVTTRMDVAVRRESVYLHYASRAQDWRVARQTQSTYIAYAHHECLAQTNPYQPGTIVPILYGECVLDLYNQRLNYIERTIASYQHGGEAQPSSTVS